MLQLIAWQQYNPDTKTNEDIAKKVKLWTNIPYQYRHRNPKQDISK